jgi:hypothetical protein
MENETDPPAVLENETDPPAPLEKQTDPLAQFGLDAIDLRWTLKDIAAERNLIVNKQHLEQLIELGLVEMREDVPHLTIAGQNTIWKDYGERHHNAKRSLRGRIRLGDRQSVPVAPAPRLQADRHQPFQPSPVRQNIA